MAYALVSKTIQFDEKEVEFTVKVFVKPWHTKEKRVDGNPTMIEQFEELFDEITGLLEDMDDEIKWEYEE